MKLCLLHLDDALLAQTDFIGRCESSGARHVQAQPLGRTVRLWSRNAALEQLASVIRDQATPASEGPRLWFMGSGDFHHISALLIDRALAEQDEPVTIIHFDNHPDWVHFDGGMHCGSWVNRAAANPKVAKIITLGVTSKDLKMPEWKGANLELMRSGKLELFPFQHAPSRVTKDYANGAGYTQSGKHIHWHTIAELGDGPFLELLLSRIETRNVYLTIDKDVLSHEDAATNWDQGSLRLPYLLAIIAAIGKQCRIIGADVTGDYSTPRYSGNLLTRAKKHAEIAIDQPHGKVDLANVARINSAGNHALLDVLQQVMA